MSIHEAFGLWSSMQFEDHGWTPLSRKQVMQTAPPPTRLPAGVPKWCPVPHPSSRARVSPQHHLSSGGYVTVKSSFRVP